MDVVQTCLDIVPLPYLSVAFKTFRLIWTSVSSTKASKEQMRTLVYEIAQLLRALDGQYRQQKLLPQQTSSSLEELRGVLLDIATFTKKQAETPFFQLLFTKDGIISQIQSCHAKIGALAQSFQISAIMDVQIWQRRNEQSRIKDQQELDEKLRDLEANQHKLEEVLNMQSNNMMAMMVALQKQLAQQPTQKQERSFFEHSLLYLSTCSGRHVTVEDWMITPYEVEFHEQIGSGGFGQVFMGTWSKIKVALKVFKPEGGVTPSSESIRNEIDIWSKLRHPNVLLFLGANILDDRPFIVMPYMKNGNAREFSRRHPRCDKLQILYDISLGLHYLHSKNIIHGDLKGMNVLVDENEHALLCDFGLTQIKADVTSRTARQGMSAVVGSRNWMAAERLLGGSLRKPSDIWSFGMTVVEIFTNEIPLSNINYSDFIELVVRSDVRPERPDNSHEIGLTDDIWGVTESCWQKDTSLRPTSSALCDLLATVRSQVRGPTQTMAKTPPRVSHRTLPQKSTRTPALASFPSKPAEVAALPRLLQGSLEGMSFVTGKSCPSEWESKPWPMTFSSDLRLLATGSGSGICISDMDTGRSWELTGHYDIVTSIAFSKDGQRIVTGSEDQQLGIWNSAPGSYITPGEGGHRGPVLAVAFSLNGNNIASGSADTTIQVWDLTKRNFKSFPGHIKSVTCLDFSPDGKSIASGSQDKTIRIWNIESGISRQFNGHSDSVRCISWSPDGQYLASGSEDTTIRIWDVPSGTSRQFSQHFATVTSIAFSPDGQWVASGSEERTVRVLSLAHGCSTSTPSFFKGHTGTVSCVTFSTDSRCIVSACIGGLIRAWSSNDLNLLFS